MFFIIRNISYTMKYVLSLGNMYYHSKYVSSSETFSILGHISYRRKCFYVFRGGFRYLGPQRIQIMPKLEYPYFIVLEYPYFIVLFLDVLNWLSWGQQSETKEGGKSVSKIYGMRGDLKIPILPLLQNIDGVQGTLVLTLGPWSGN